MAAPFAQNPRNRSVDLGTHPLPFRLTTPNDALVLLTAYWPGSQHFHILGMMDGGRFQNLPVRDISEGVRQALELSKSGVDIYFALAEFGSAESRKADNVVSVRGLWLDIDCGEEKAAAGKGYATVELAWDAFSRFCAEIGIPLPTHVVLSGGGLHAHWILTEGLDPAAWKSTAKKFKQLTEAWGFLADPSRTADIASVLRLPGTLNHKYDPTRAVTLVKSSSEYIDTDAFCRAVEEAYARWCSAPVVAQPRATVTKDQPQGRPDLEKVGVALTVLDPDCEEVKWTFYLAAMARAACDHPEDAEALRTLGRDWSSGALRGVSSEKWRKPGSKGLTGEQMFDRVWDRFLHEQDRDGPVITLKTIIHDGQLAGAPPVVIPGDALSYLQTRFALIVLNGDLFVVDLTQDQE
jgi:hypothetical protein